MQWAEMLKETGTYTSVCNVLFLSKPTVKDLTPWSPRKLLLKLGRVDKCKCYHDWKTKVNLQPPVKLYLAILQRLQRRVFAERGRQRPGTVDRKVVVRQTEKRGEVYYNGCKHSLSVEACVAYMSSRSDVLCLTASAKAKALAPPMLLCDKLPREEIWK